MHIRGKWVVTGGAVAGGLFFLLMGIAGYLVLHRAAGDYFDSQGVRIHYAIDGEGPPLILIHGLAAQSDWNWRLPGVIRRLSPHFQVISIDLRGHGLSDKPKDPTAYGPELAEDVIRLMDHLSISKAYVAGYSLGGFIAVRLLADHPDRIKAAAVCAAGWKDPKENTPIPNPYVASGEKKDTGKAREYVSSAGMPAIEENTGDERLLFRIRRSMGNLFVDSAAMDAVRRSLAQVMVPAEKLADNPVPTCCLIGDKDGLLNLAEDLKAHMDRLTLTVIPGADHLTMPFNRTFQEDLLTFFLKN